jgi:5S rRNA maturation endonuclease (ribonuclease M5)
MIKSHSRQPHKDREPFKVHAQGPTFGDMERASRLREVLEALSEVNKKFPVIVEGKRDAMALRRLGLAGEVIVLHSGNNLYEFSEDISERFERVVILLDWDEKGEHLTKTIQKHLRGQWEEFSAFREILRILCQKDIKDIEGIPKLLGKLEGDEAAGH